MSHPKPPAEAAAPGPSASAASSAPHEATPLPLDRTSPQLTLRALVTGAALGAILCSCNIYTGLTIGWGLNMSITAVLLGYALWRAMQRTARVRPLSMLENNINMTAVSSAAAVSSAGLVAPIPALTMLTGQTLEWWALALWVFTVCMVGITIGIPLRRQMLVVDRLPFPAGVATAETLREMYAKGTEALARVKTMLLAAVFAVIVKCLANIPAALSWLLGVVGLTAETLRSLGLPLTKWGLPFTVRKFTAGSLTFALDPSLLMVGVGGLIGFRACVSLLLGSVLAWLVLAPALLEKNWIRLTIQEPLPVLPATVVGRLPPEPEGFARYKPEARVLEYKGAMTAAQRDDLLSLSDDPRWQEAVYKLYVRSQLRPAVSPEVVAADPQFTTTRDVQSGVELGNWPRSLTIPREFGHMLRYDHRGRRLVAIGLFSEECRAVMRERVAAVARARPDQQAACDAVLAALDQLHARTRQPLLPPDVELPPDLAGRVTWDETTRTLRVQGPLTASDAARLKTLCPGDVDFGATVNELLAGSRFVPAQPNFGDLVQWLLWPGVTLMVVSSLVAFGFSWRSLLRTFTSLGRRQAGNEPVEDTGEVAVRWFAGALVLTLIIALALQVWFFAIAWWAAVLGVLLSFALALVAARVSGETGVTPVGAMGKITQFVFGVLIPNNPAPNLMTANITGGAASQCADLLHDLKAGYLLGASPRQQVVAQVVGALVGALAGSAAYLILVPHPAEQLITEQWPAPAVATWKAVAELFAVGLKALPPGTPTAVLIAALLGIALPVLERTAPKAVKPYIPSAASVGLAFVINGFNAISMFIGGTLVLILSKLFPNWTKRFAITLCAGLVAGESLTGVYIAFERMVTG